MRPRAKIFVAVVVATGLCTAAFDLARLRVTDFAQFATYFILAVASTRFAVSLPSIPGTLSAVFLFDLLSIIELSLAEALVIACTANVCQSILNAKKSPELVKVVFSMAAQALTIHSAFFVYHACRDLLGVWGILAGLLCTSFLVYLMNSSMVATAVALVAGKAPYETWKSSLAWSFPYYLAGGGLAGMIGVASHAMGWQTSLLLLPVMYLFYRSFTTYMGRLDDAKKHAEEMSALHLRTIESLALAIEAKDDTTHAHLRRVQTYAVAIGEQMGLEDNQIEALRAAAILHDIGKLAVPEHIICKPGKLTPEEFEKMKIHPVVGAEILEHVKFPYPVAPIVLSHHEKWNGTGYPHGLKGEEIPIGARILAAVDCLDALASDRQYRKALPLPEAMQVVISESGKSFDPIVVDLLRARYVELEKSAQAACADLVKLSTNLTIDRGDSPDAGFESSAAKAPGAHGGLSLTQAIAVARTEIRNLFEHDAERPESVLTLSESLTLLMSRFKPLIPHEAMAMWILKGEHLHPVYVEGANASMFRSLNIPLGEGLAGWVCQNEKPIVNGNPAVEPGYLNDPSKFTTLRSAIAVPLKGYGEFSGVLAFYSAERDAYQRDHLRILQSISAKLADSIESALARGAKAKSSSGDGAAPTPVDRLTGLPSLAGIIDRADQELSRCRRSNATCAVLVCDLDGSRKLAGRAGRAALDKVLCEFGAGLRGIFRDYDLVARLGGDEFAVIVPEIGKEDMEARIREVHLVAMEAGRLALGNYELSITVGAAYFPADGEMIEVLLNEADRRRSVNKTQKKQQGAAAAAGNKPTLEKPAPGSAVEAADLTPVKA